MRPQIESLLRVVAVGFLVFGAVRFTQVALELPMERLLRLMTPPQVMVTQQEFRGSLIPRWAEAAAPAMMGLLLIGCRRRIASVIGPEEGWPLILGRTIIIAGVGVVMSLLLERVFNRAMIVMIFESVMSTPTQWFDSQFWFQTLRTSIPLLPLGVLWLLMRRLTTSETKPVDEAPRGT